MLKKIVIKSLTEKILAKNLHFEQLKFIVFDVKLQKTKYLIICNGSNKTIFAKFFSTHN
jgi:hypothetical protein